MTEIQFGNEEARAILKDLYHNGLTQVEIAFRLGVDSSTVSKFINHRTNSSPKIVQRLNERYHIEFGSSSNISRSSQVLKPQEKTSPISSIAITANSYDERDEPKKAAVSSVDRHLQHQQKQTRKLKEAIIAPIDISYREDGNGKGAFYDHYTFQHATNHPTRVVHSPQMSTRKLAEHMRNETLGLPFNNRELPSIASDIEKDLTSHQIPIDDDDQSDGGLLIIPGEVAKSVDKEREIFEKEIIRKALLRGRPILAICAGSWRLWGSFGGKLRSVHHHNNAKMLCLSNKGYVTYNTDVHSVLIDGESLITKSIVSLTKNKENSVRGDMTENSIRMKVNSVHDKAPDDFAKRSQDDFVVVTARSIDDGIVRRMANPDVGTVEAFETKNGSPVVGIQWHPEGYFHYLRDNKPSTSTKQTAILKYMAMAGDAYARKRRMLKEIELLFCNNR